MSAHCCGHHHQDPGGDPLRQAAYQRVLWCVLAINAMMFAVEIGAGLAAGSAGFFQLWPSAAVEFTPIKDWLEIEAGIAPLFSRGRTEWDADLRFKKPFTLSDKLEFMFGVGPQWTFSRDGTKIAGEVALDFMFWPTPDRTYGWFLEPAYSYSFSAGHEQSLGITVGLLIPIP
jgi:hypothetical protein